MARSGGTPGTPRAVGPHVPQETRSVWDPLRTPGRVGFLVAFCTVSGCLLSAVRSCLWYPVWDDGPFRGVACDVAPGPLDAPLDMLELIGGGRLESHPVEPGVNAPRVVLRARDGSVAWCIRAQGQEGTQVTELHFDDARLTVMPGYHVVTGRVVWTYGHERTTWWLRPDGSLVQYWYSW